MLEDLKFLDTQLLLRKNLLKVLLKRKHLKKEKKTTNYLPVIEKDTRKIAKIKNSMKNSPE